MSAKRTTNITPIITQAGRMEPAAGMAGAFYIRTNSGGRTFRLVQTPVTTPERGSWREVIGNRANVMLSGVDVFAGHVVLFEREDGLPYLRIVDLENGQGDGSENREIDLLTGSHRIEFGTGLQRVVGDESGIWDGQGAVSVRVVCYAALGV